MTKPIFIGWDRCSTCKKAQKYLNEHSIEYEFRDIMTENPKEEELTKWILESGFPIKRFFNVTGLMYRELNLKDRLKTMSDKEQIALLATDGKLIKRPLLIGEHGVLVGFNEAMYETLIQ